MRNNAKLYYEMNVFFFPFKVNHITYDVRVEKCYILSGTCDASSRRAYIWLKKMKSKIENHTHGTHDQRDDNRRLILLTRHSFLFKSLYNSGAHFILSFSFQCVPGIFFAIKSKWRALVKQQRNKNKLGCPKHRMIYFSVGRIVDGLNI